VPGGSRQVEPHGQDSYQLEHHAECADPKIRPVRRWQDEQNDGNDGKEHTVWRYSLADGYDEETLRKMADRPAGDGLF
jgi:hypothetical protein